MKKFLSLILIVALVFSFSGCLDTDDTPQKEQYGEGSNTEESVQKEETFGLNESAVFDELKITAIEIVENNGSDFFTPEEGNVFVGVKFVIENISDEEQTVSSLLLFDAYADDVKSEYSFNASCAFSNGTLDGTIASGKKLEGWYPMEVPQNWQSVELNVKADWLSTTSATFVFAK